MITNLSSLLPNQKGQIIGFRGGRGLVMRLNALGLTIGTEVTMLHNAFAGPVIIMVRDTRLALGRGEAMKVLVEIGPEAGFPQNQ